MRAIYLNDGTLPTSSHGPMPDYYGEGGEAKEVDESTGIFAFYPDRPTSEGLPIKCDPHELKFVRHEAESYADLRV